ncbi:MAG: redoxin domain-containing protein [Oscillospiraceae bacterium]|nr:redoxin domain-containing protein [Oscillospiraceae bacterium]
MTVYDFTVRAQDGREVSLEEYRGKVLLIVNTATGCGFTPQYTQLQELYDKHQAEGLEILDFPCNQFANQAPGDDAEIHSFCTGRFGIRFPQFSKVDVIGENAIPLYRWLSENSSFSGFGKGPRAMLMAAAARSMDKASKNNGAIQRKYTKILSDRDGTIVARCEPTEDRDRVAKRGDAARQ